MYTTTLSNGSTDKVSSDTAFHLPIPKKLQLNSSLARIHRHTVCMWNFHEIYANFIVWWSLTTLMIWNLTKKILCCRLAQRGANQKCSHTHMRRGKNSSTHLIWTKGKWPRIYLTNQTSIRIKHFCSFRYVITNTAHSLDNNTPQCQNNYDSIALPVAHWKAKLNGIS